MKTVFSPSYTSFQTDIINYIDNTESERKVIWDQRNTIFRIKINDISMAVKAFKRPNLFNRIVYRYFRKSKAERSYRYAQFFLKEGINTPEPIAYMEKNGFLFSDSYYISKYLNYDFSFKDLLEFSDTAKRNKILKQFTAFTYQLHEKRIEFLDHSQSNTLIVDRGRNKYEFYLVDLNRMKFHSKPLSFRMRMRNFARLTHQKEIVREMSKTYAELIGKDFESVFTLMWMETETFFRKIDRKQKLKAIFLS